MKLNNKRTILVGLAFLSICSFWQMYDNIVPLILTRTFHMNETLSGAIMAADNILALFLLPFLTVSFERVLQSAPPQMLEAGASRIGTSRGVEIVEELKKQGL